MYDAANIVLRVLHTYIRRGQILNKQCKNLGKEEIKPKYVVIKNNNKEHNNKEQGVGHE